MINHVNKNAEKLNSKERNKEMSVTPILKDPGLLIKDLRNLQLK